jgi:hypothetical protein
MDTGTGSGIHVGGEGKDTFRIGAEILSNGAIDTIIAWDFKIGKDSLDLGDGLLTGATIVDISFDAKPVLDTLNATGLFGEDLKAKRDIVADGKAVERDLGFIQDYTVGADGTILLSASQVTLASGDIITLLGVTKMQLEGLLS